jgi:hypothetical protein
VTSSSSADGDNIERESGAPASIASIRAIRSPATRFHPSTTELEPIPLATNFCAGTTPAPKPWKATSTSRLRPEKAGYFLVQLFRTRNGARRPKCPVNEAIDSGNANVDASRG